MKTLKQILILLTIVTLNAVTSAQVKVHSDGDISLGTTNIGSENIRLYGSVLFKHPSSSYDLRYSYYYGSEPLFAPTTNGKGYLGYDALAWHYVHSFYVRYKYGCTQYSDLQIKKNIVEIGKDEGLDKISNLHPKKFDIDYNDGYEELGKNKVGLIAQEVLPVIPEIVCYDSSAQLYSIDYFSIIPYLIAAINKQSELIEEQNIKIESLEQELIEDIDLQAKSAGEDETENLNFDSEIQPFLGNNIPNPVDQATEIEFYLPQEISNADFYIYDLQGKQIMKFEVVEREYSSINIQGSQLMPGMYYYSLIADSRVIGTKQMILTD